LALVFLPSDVISIEKILSSQIEKDRSSVKCAPFKLHRLAKRRDPHRLYKCAFMQSVIIPNAIMLSVMAPLFLFQHFITPTHTPIPTLSPQPDLTLLKPTQSEMIQPELTRPDQSPDQTKPNLTQPGLT
jgi:hypothetical protein